MFLLLKYLKKNFFWLVWSKINKKNHVFLVAFTWNHPFINFFCQKQKIYRVYSMPFYKWKKESCCFGAVWFDHFNKPIFSGRTVPSTLWLLYITTPLQSSNKTIYSSYKYTLKTTGLLVLTIRDPSKAPLRFRV